MRKKTVLARIILSQSVYSTSCMCKGGTGAFGHLLSACCAVRPPGTLGGLLGFFPLRRQNCLKLRVAICDLSLFCRALAFASELLWIWTWLSPTENTMNWTELDYADGAALDCMPHASLPFSALAGAHSISKAGMSKQQLTHSTTSKALDVIKRNSSSSCARFLVGLYHAVPCCVMLVAPSSWTAETM